MLLGSAFGAFYAGQLADHIGRKQTMVLTATVFALGAVGAGLAPSALVFVLFRVFGGVAVGAASVIGPAYIAEVAPAQLRGRLGSLQQLAIVLGIFIAFVSNYGLARLAGSADAAFWLGLKTWRWMLCIQVLPSVAYGIGAMLVPESPRYLVARGKLLEAEEVLHHIGEPSPRNKIEEISRTTTRDTKPRIRDLFQHGRVVAIVWVGLGLATFQQLVGINVVFYYGAVLWQAAGFSEGQSLLINVVSGAVNIMTTLVGMGMIDRFGRKPVLMAGSVGMVFSLSVLAWAFAQATSSGAQPHLDDQTALLALLAAHVYIFFFGFSWGPIVWVMLGEIFNNRIRGSAMSVCTAVGWLANFAVAMTFPIMQRGLGLPFAYGVYAFAALASLLFVYLRVAETTGVELEAMT